MSNKAIAIICVISVEVYAEALGLWGIETVAQSFGFGIYGMMMAVYLMARRVEA